MTLRERFGGAVFVLLTILALAIMGAAALIGAPGSEPFAIQFSRQVKTFAAAEAPAKESERIAIQFSRQVKTFAAAPSLDCKDLKCIQAHKVGLRPLAVSEPLAVPWRG